MPWSAINLDVNVLEGLARFDLTSAAVDSDPIGVDPYIEEMAKKTVVRRVTVGCGSFVLSEGGQAAFFDSLSTLATSGQPLEAPVQEMIGYAYLHHWARGENIGINHRLLEDSIYYDQRLDEAVKAFCVIAPVEMVTAGSNVTVGETRTVSVSGSVTFT